MLGLTGTATKSCKTSICDMLKIDEGGIIYHGFMRPNLKISVTKVEDGDEVRAPVLVELLRSKTYKDLKSIIIYVMFQKQADKLSEVLKLKNIYSESYHAGKSAQDRRLTQSKFLRGKLSIIIATVAFGMGINKKDVDAVIHYCIPKTIENYIQEIGRAGRDGRDAYCHLFLCQEDYIKHRSFAFSDQIDENNYDRLIKKIVNLSKSGFIALNVKECETEFDIKKDVLSTLLSYLAVEFPDDLQVFPIIDSNYNIFFMNGHSIEKLGQEYEWIFQLSLLGTKGKHGCLSFNVFEVIFFN